ncbi:MAG: response regulator, partial [Chloroflexota bacterium]|nr:response regulator [Chloroflexota bacterium]
MMAKEQGNILIVDDEENIRNLLHHILEKQGYHCEEAATADQALEQIKNSPVDLVLLDIMMPDQSGTRLLSQIKERYPDIMVIMATATQDMDTAVETIRHGAYDYITKPFNLAVVIQSVKRALEKRKLECDLQEYKQHLEDKVEEQAKQIRETSLGAMRSLSFALEANDRYTAGHSRRVTEFSLAIGRALHLSKKEMENLRWGSMLHDIGKIAVDPCIINKPRKLTREEYTQVMTHTMVGASIVGTVIAHKDIIGIIEHHHDRYDG